MISTPIDFSRVQALPHHHPQWANAANDAGPLPADQPMEGLTLVLARSAAQEAAFEHFLADQQNPASADYHHWLTAAEIGERFGTSDADLAAIKSWLQSQGLQVSWVAPSKTFVGFGGTAAGVSRAFQTELRNYHVNGRNLVSVSSDPMVPQAVAPSIKAIRGLYTIEDDPQSRARVMQMDSPDINLTGTEHVMGPGDFDVIYDVQNTYKGSGEKIGIVARSRTDVADFTNFQSLMGTTFASPTEVVPTAFGGVDPGPALTSPPSSGVSTGDQAEATLDVERAGSVAPGAQLLLVVTTQASGGIEVDAQYLVQTVPTPVQVMNVSFGGCESAAGPSGVNFWDSLFQQAAAEGISTFVASGDSGASGCDAAFTAPPASPKANSPNYICSSSYATCVGGTEFNDARGVYWTGPVGLATSAIEYIPEGGWNESWNGTTSTVAASGGGVSSVIATPSWQQGVPGVPTNNSGRYTPDVAFSAAEHDGYFGCVAAGGGNCLESNQEIPFLIFSGTSAGSPSMAGVAAMLDQSLSATQGNLNPALYQIWFGGPGAFHDVTLNTDGLVSCDINTPSMCNNSIPGPSGLSGGQAGYEVGTGYDEVTGLGSLDIGAFIYLYPTATKIMTPTVGFEQTQTFNTYEPITIEPTVVAGPSSPPPTGNVAVTIGSYNSAPAPVKFGYATINIPAGTFPVGNYTVNATYTPDAASTRIYTSASGTSSLTITVPPAVQPTVLLNPSQTVITNSQSITLGVVVNPAQYYPNPTGSVTLSGGGYTSGPVVLVNQGATFNIPAGSLSVGQNSLNVTYTPDTASVPNYLTASTSVSIQNDGAKLMPTIFVSPNPLTATNAQTIAITVDVTGFVGDPGPTGTVVLTGGGYTSAPASLSNGSAVVTAPPGTFPLGPNTVTSTFTPDAQSSALYGSVSASSTVTLYLAQLIAPTVTVTPLTQNLTTIVPLSVMVTVSGGAGNPIPTGSVTVPTAGGLVTATLTGGTTTLTLPAGTFAGGTDSVSVVYLPDQTASYAYASASGTTSINVAKVTPAVTITPSPSSFSTQQSTQVTVSVSGGSGAPAASGVVILTAGYSVLGADLSSSGTASFTIPAGTIVAGADTLSVAYSGDSDYNAATGTDAVTVSAPGNAAFTVSGGSLSVTKGFPSSNTLTVTTTPTNGFVGTVALTAAITSSPAGAQDLPTMSITPGSVNLLEFSAVSSTLTFTTTAASSAKIVHSPGSWMHWSAASAPVLACIALWLVPLRRRLWRNLMMLFAALAVVIAGGVTACGGSGGGTGTGTGIGGGNPGTTSGQYTITITGTSGATTVTNTITLTVQ